MIIFDLVFSSLTFTKSKGVCVMFQEALWYFVVGIITLSYYGMLVSTAAMFVQGLRELYSSGRINV